MIVVVMDKTRDHTSDGVSLEKVRAFLLKRARLRNMAPPRLAVSILDQVETQVAETKEPSEAEPGLR